MTKYNAHAQVREKKNDAKKKKEKRRETATVWRSYARYADPDYSTTPVNKT